MPPRLAFYLVMLAATCALVFVIYSVSLSADTWRAIVFGLGVGTVGRFEKPFVRWWNTRRARRYLADHPLGRRSEN